MKREICMVRFLALTVFAFECGHGYPRIHNLLDRPIFVDGEYRNGEFIRLQLRSVIVVRSSGVTLTPAPA